MFQVCLKNGNLTKKKKNMSLVSTDISTSQNITAVCIFTFLSIFQHPHLSLVPNINSSLAFRKLSYEKRGFQTHSNTLPTP